LKTWAFGRIFTIGTLTLLASCASAPSSPQRITTYEMEARRFGLTTLPLTAAMTLDKRGESAIQEFDVACKRKRYAMALDEEFTKVAVPALSEAFSSLTLVPKNDAVGKYDLIIETTVPTLALQEIDCELTRWWHLMLPIPGWLMAPLTWHDDHTATVAAEIRFGATVKDRQGRVLFNQEYGRKDTALFPPTSARFSIPRSEWQREFHQVFSRSLQDAVREFTLALNDSIAVRTFARSMHAKDKAKPVQDIVPAVAPSDVDDVTSTPVRRRHNAYAVVIGVEHYRRIPSADYATRDALIMAQYLTKVMGYPEEHVMVLLNENASLTDLRKHVEHWLPNNVEPDGTVFVYYAGQGAPNVSTKDGYILPYDADPAYLDITGYSLHRLYETLGALPAKEIIVVLDSNFCGVGTRSIGANDTRPIKIEMKQRVLQSAKMAVLTATSGTQAGSLYAEQGHSVFTYFLLKGLKRDNDVNRDGIVDLSELFGYLERHVPARARTQDHMEQEPQLIAAPALNTSIHMAAVGRRTP
jgi:hypothetical protein